MRRQMATFTDDEGYMATLVRQGTDGPALATIAAPTGTPCITAWVHVNDVCEDTAQAVLAETRARQPMFGHRDPRVAAR